MTVTTTGPEANDIDGKLPVSPLVPDTPLPLPRLCAKVHDRVVAFLDEKDISPQLKSTQDQTRMSLDVICEALDRYSLSELSLAYNGGKDCLVLLILYLCALHKKGLTRAIPNNTAGNHHEPIQAVYIQAAHPFIEVDEFVASSVKIYSLSIVEYAKPMKAAFTDYLHDTPSVKAIFVGTRRTDPHGANLKHFDPTDHGWPEFMRIHPVIDWHYGEIWTFIRHLNIPYCVLYDRGYTSLGGTTDTHPNPALRQASSIQVPKTDASNGVVNGTCTPKFRPAYELVDDYEERLGRDR
ncbi:adenine nucleotide alpha hydrolases-like protein [Zopfia rhizophila CBS 207.26]|uniref:FAD synthase n=1 Tax=Zopfia rhizophila CBS 207.26 TaxID=1314779 RepID=A0A6A6EDF1_9PEZI|nr:adenine nucleotide alpha hydrolases-like protein [Zopfia rhizophila CBS 207.26]